MRDYLFGRARSPGSGRSLSSRGHFLKSFAGIGYCLAFSLLALGGYGMEEQFANPLQAQPAGLLVSASLIATAVTLLYLLLHRFRQIADPAAPWPASISRVEERAIVRFATSSEENRKAIPPHGRYVDRAFVRIHR
jgi:hypothetical protein